MNVRALVAVALLAGGCASAAPVEHPALDIALPENWTARELPDGQFDVTWWEDFGDGGLAAVVDIALSQNYDLRAAAARLEQAAADARAAEGDLQPTVQGTFKALFMTVWCPDSRSVESNCGIPRG